MCAGVGKTYEMLQAAHEARKKGIDVVIGFVETHGRAETEALLPGLTLIPRKTVDYRGTSLEELDIDAVLARKPALALVDELAHTNAPGSRHTKRYLDVVELLDNGIDVFTTLNVQHLESRADAVAQFSGAIVHETVPDSIFAQADEVEVIDLPPDELLRRLADGKVYTPERSTRAAENFFRPGNLTALREMALRLAAERVERQLREYMKSEKIPGPWKSGARLIVGITPSRDSVHLIRWTRRLAFTMQASWVAVFVETASQPAATEKELFARNVALARELGAEIVTTADADIAAAIVRVAREQNATQIIVGRPAGGMFWRKTLVDRLIELSTDVDVCVTSGEPTPGRAGGRRIRLPESRSGFVQYLTAGVARFPGDRRIVPVHGGHRVPDGFPDLPPDGRPPPAALRGRPRHPRRDAERAPLELFLHTAEVHVRHLQAPGHPDGDRVLRRRHGDGGAHGQGARPRTRRPLPRGARRRALFPDQRSLLGEEPGRRGGRGGRQHPEVSSAPRRRFS